MEEKIWEKLFKLGDVLHWLGKYEEMQAVQALAKHLREEGIEDWRDIRFEKFPTRKTPRGGTQEGGE